MADSPTFSSVTRRALLLELATRSGRQGISIAEVHAEAMRLGDRTSKETYHNIARRLAHRGLLDIVADTDPTLYRTEADEDRYLEDEDLVRLIDPDYPLTALPVWTEAAREVHQIPESIWIALRRELAGQDARALFCSAIVSYANDLDALIREAKNPDNPVSDRHNHTASIERAISLLRRLCRFGLGLSEDAIAFPESSRAALNANHEPVRWDPAILHEELERRIEPGPFIHANLTVFPLPQNDLIGAVDGSSRMGALSVLGEDGALPIGYAPQVSINTAIGWTDRQSRTSADKFPPFLRLPERPEDVQRGENRHAIMAKLLYPELSESEYMHAVWNAMDLLETRTALRLMARWTSQDRRVEMPPATVVLRDGAASPQDRDWSHYQKQSVYGRICRELIQESWHVAVRTKEDQRTVVGVIKEAQLFVYAPVINWFATRLAAQGRQDIKQWPLETFNNYSDQLLLTRLLTSGRKADDNWTRTCVSLRPFAALSSFGTRYRRAKPPSEWILREEVAARAAIDEHGAAEKEEFWYNFEGARDPFVKHLDHVHYANFFLGALPRLERSNYLPRFEVLLCSESKVDTANPWHEVAPHVNRALAAVKRQGFDVAAEHNMFTDEPRLDVLPALLIRAHEVVKIWASELLGRVQEFVRYHVGSILKSRATVRPFSRRELQTFVRQMQDLRDREAGGSIDSSGVAKARNPDES